jgi:hypothetical protein
VALNERLALLVTLDAKGAVKGFNDIGRAAEKNLKGADKSLDQTASKFKKVGAGMLGTGALAATGLAKAAMAASDLNETASQTEQIFGDAAGQVGEFATGAAQALGQSERAAREAANTFGLFFTNAGKSAEEAASMSTELATLASDMASFKNTSPEQAVEALGAALRGESEPIRLYGVMLDDATLKQRALDDGLIRSTKGTLPPAIKMQAAYAEILAQTGTIQGDFARTSEGLANQQRILAAEFENAKAAIGTGALPVMTKLTSVAADAAKNFSALDESTGGAVSTIATIGTGAVLAAGGLSFAVGQVISMRGNLSKLKGPLTNSTGGLSKLGAASAGLGFVGAAVAVASFADSLGQSRIDVTAFSTALADMTVAQEEQTKTGVLALDQFGQLDGVMTDMIATNAAGAERLIDVAEAAGIGADKIADYREELDASRSSSAQLSLDQEENARATEAATRALEGYTTASDLAPSKMGAVSRAVDEQKDKVAELRTQFEELTDTLRGSIDADFAYEDSIASTEDALRRLRETQNAKVGDDLTAEQKQRDIAAATRDARDALVDQADAAAEAAAQAFELSGKTLTAAEKQGIFRDELDKLRDGLAAGSPLREAIDGTIGRLDTLAQDRTATVTVAIREEQRLGAIAKLTQIDGGRAIGGPVSAGSSYLVNEYGRNGPEIFTPSVNGTISPGSAGSSGGTSIEQTVNIYNPIAEPVSESARRLRSIELEVAAR